MVRNKQKMYDLIVMDTINGQQIFGMDINTKQFKMMSKINPTRSRRGIYNGFHSKRTNNTSITLSSTQNRERSKLRPRMGKLKINTNNGNNNAPQCDIPNQNTFNNRKSEHLMSGNIGSTFSNINGTHLQNQQNGKNPLIPSFVDHVSSLMSNNNNMNNLQSTFNQQPQMMDIDENILKFLQSTMNQNANINTNPISPLMNGPSSSLLNCGNNMMNMNINNTMNNNILSTALGTIQQNTQNTQNTLKLHSNPMNNSNPNSSISSSISFPSFISTPSLSSNCNNNNIDKSPISPSSPNNNMNQSSISMNNISPKMLNLLRPPSSYIPNANLSDHNNHGLSAFNGGNNNINNNHSNTNTSTSTSTNGSGSRSPIIGNGTDYDLLSQNSGDTVMSEQGDFANIELITLLCQAVLNGNGDNDKINQDMNKIIQMQNLSQTILNATNVMKSLPNNATNTSNLMANMPKLDDNLNLHGMNNGIITDNNNNNNNTNKISHE